jgi:hypothetical protein
MGAQQAIKLTEFKRSSENFHPVMMSAGTQAKIIRWDNDGIFPVSLQPEFFAVIKHKANFK